MKRREEIVTATLGCRQNYVELKRPITPDDVADAFEKGAYWADKTMIEKVCQWLKFNTNWDDEWDDMGRNLNYGMIEEFRKAMLEEE